MAVNKNLNSEELEHIVCDVFPTLIEPGSLAHRLLIQSREEGREEGREKGREKGREEGREEGRLAGKIQTLQEMLGDRPSTDEELREQDLEQLKNVVTVLQGRLRKRDE
jgi:predicted transposase YdaD